MLSPCVGVGGHRDGGEGGGDQWGGEGEAGGSAGAEGGQEGTATTLSRRKELQEGGALQKLIGGARADAAAVRRLGVCACPVCPSVRAPRRRRCPPPLNNGARRRQQNRRQHGHPSRRFPPSRGTSAGCGSPGRGAGGWGVGGSPAGRPRAIVRAAGGNDGWEKPAGARPPPRPAAASPPRHPPGLILFTPGFGGEPAAPGVPDPLFGRTGRTREGATASTHRDAFPPGSVPLRSPSDPKKPELRG